jgi:hypothetical protein
MELNLSAKARTLRSNPGCPITMGSMGSGPRIASAIAACAAGVESARRMSKSTSDRSGT